MAGEDNADLLLVENALPVPPRLKLEQVTLWCEYPIWGLLLYDDQSPWLSLLETIHICFSREEAKKEVFGGPETDGAGQPVHEWLTYNVPLSPALRHLLFIDQDIEEIAASPADDASMWAMWEKAVDKSCGIDPKQLRQLFPQFQDLASAVALLRSSQIDGNNRRRPTSRHLLPLGESMILADVSEVKHNPDRRWLRRTGELMYLMLNRSGGRTQIEELLRKRLLSNSSPWNRLTRKLQGKEALEPEPKSLTTGYLPLPNHAAYERLAEDWLAILSLGKMPIATSLASLARVSGLNLMSYVIERSVETIGDSHGHVPPFVMDMIGGSWSGGLRKLSASLYQRHRNLPQEAMTAFIRRYRATEEWQKIEHEGASQAAATALASRFLWTRDIGSNPDAMPSPAEQIEDLLIEAQKKRSHSVGAMYVSHGRLTGSLIARAGVGTWYAPNDELIEALVLANVTGPMELDAFLSRLYARYRIVIGAEEALCAFGELPETQAAFRENERRFEERLRMLGYLERKSDDCAFVSNPFHPAGAPQTEDA